MKKRILSVFLVISMLSTLIPGLSIVANATSLPTVSYQKWTGTEFEDATCTDYEIVTDSSSSAGIGGGDLNEDSADVSTSLEIMTDTSVNKNNDADLTNALSGNTFENFLTLATGYNASHMTFAFPQDLNQYLRTESDFGIKFFPSGSGSAVQLCKNDGETLIYNGKVYDVYSLESELTPTSDAAQFRTYLKVGINKTAKIKNSNPDYWPTSAANIIAVPGNIDDLKDGSQQALFTWVQYYKITLDANGGTAGSKTSFNIVIDEDMPALTSTGELPTKQGFTFNGFFDAATDGTKYYNADGTSAKKWDKTSANTTLYAQWTSNPTDPKFYAVFNTNAEGKSGEAGYKPEKTLSFYYDTNKESHIGVTGKNVYSDLPTEATKKEDWGYNAKRYLVKNVVIDDSVANYSGLKSTAYMFSDMADANDISGCEYLDVSNVTNMSNMFSFFGLDSKSLTAVPNVSDWNTGKVTDMSYMFNRYGKSSTAKLQALDLSKWSISSLTKTEHMFTFYANKSNQGDPVVYATDWSSAKTLDANNSMDMFTDSKLRNNNNVTAASDQWLYANTGTTGCFTAKPPAVETIAVNNAWAGKSAGDSVSLGGKNFTYGTDAFSSVCLAVNSMETTTKTILIAGSKDAYTADVSGKLSLNKSVTISAVDTDEYSVKLPKTESAKDTTTTFSEKFCFDGDNTATLNGNVVVKPDSVLDFSCDGATINGSLDVTDAKLTFNKYKSGSKFYINGDIKADNSKITNNYKLYILSKEAAFTNNSEIENANYIYFGDKDHTDVKRTVTFTDSIFKMTKSTAQTQTYKGVDLSFSKGSIENVSGAKFTSKGSLSISEVSPCDFTGALSISGKLSISNVEDFIVRGFYIYDGESATVKNTIIHFSGRAYIEQEHTLCMDKDSKFIRSIDSATFDPECITGWTHDEDISRSAIYGIYGAILFDMTGADEPSYLIEELTGTNHLMTMGIYSDVYSNQGTFLEKGKENGYFLKVIENDLYAVKEDYLTFKAKEESAIAANFASGSASYQISTDGGENWGNWTNCNTAQTPTVISLNKNEMVRMKGNNVITNENYHFSMTGKIDASGSVMSLIDGIGNCNATMPDGCFSYMFCNCDALITPPELTGVVLSPSCYKGMFKGCTSLASAPVLSARQLKDDCYDNMFEGCTSLAIFEGSANIANSFIWAFPDRGGDTPLTDMTKGTATVSGTAVPVVKPKISDAAGFTTYYNVKNVPVKAVGIAAQGEETYYYTLKEAIDACTGESQAPVTITLQADLAEQATISGNQNIILDLNGKTLSYAGDVITNQGTLTIKDSNKSKLGTIVSEGTGTTANSLKADGGSINIQDGNINGGISTANSGSISVSGGLFTANPNSYIEEGYKLKNITQTPYLYKVIPAATTKPVSGDFNFTPPTESTYDGTVKSAEVKAKSGITGMGEVTVKYSSDGGENWSQTAKNAGTYIVKIDVAEGEDYASETDITDSSWTFTIEKAKLTVSDTTVENKTYDGNTTATVKKGTLTGVIGVEDVSIDTATGTFENKNAGEAKEVTVSYTLKGADVDNYEVEEDTISADITKKTLTVDGTTVDSKTYDGNTTATVKKGTLVGVVGVDDVSIDTTTGDFDNKNVGKNKDVTVSYTLKGADTDNYEIDTETINADISKKVLTVSGTTVENKTYDGNTTATVKKGTLAGVIGVEDVSIDTATGTFKDKNAGEAKEVAVSYTLKGADVDNYGVEDVESSATISKRDITLKSADVTKEYDGTALTAYSKKGGTDITDVTSGQTNKGFVSGEKFNYSFFGSCLFVDSKANTYNVSDDTAKVANYNITKLNGDLIVTPCKTAIAVTPNNQTKMYDGNSNIDINDFSFTGELAYGDTAQISLKNANNVNDAGTYENGIVVGIFEIFHNNGDGTLTDVSSCYDNVNIGKATLVINKRDVKMTSASDSKIYDGTPLTNHNVMLSGSGFVAGEGATYNFTGSQTFAGKSDNTFTYTLNKGTKAGNYDITTENGNIEVSKKTLKIYGITASNKVYDGTETATINTANAIFEGIAPCDTLTVSTTGVFSDKNAGENKTVTFSELVIDGDAKDNYIIDENSQKITEATIDKKALAITADNQESYVNSDFKNLTYKSLGLLDIDCILGLLALEENATNDKIGTYQILLGTITAGDNYDIIYTPGEYKVVKRVVQNNTGRSSGSSSKSSGVSLGQTITTPVQEAVDSKKTIKLTIGKTNATVFGENVVNDVAPIIRNDRTMLPCRFVAESLGATVEWNGAERKVWVTTADGKTVIELVIDNPIALVNGVEVTLDSAPFIENDRTYLPVRFIAEALGAEVIWNETTKEVTIVVK